jgi:serine/threonine protein kinase
LKHGAKLANSICLAISVVLCLTALFYSSAHAISPAHAARETVTGSIVSSPSSGPVGATITVSGSSWPEPDGEQVSFGYIIAGYNCLIVSDSQAGTFHGGSFSGWFRWPNGIPLGTYTVCATFGSTTGTANTYTLLSTSAPQVFISPTILTAGKSATITGSNYFPAGTTVQLSWETMNGSVVVVINPAISNANGAISRTFVVPTTIRSGGSNKIVAEVGGGQPPTLSSSVTFTYNAPALNSSPTPNPASDPTPTIGFTTPASSQQTSNGQTSNSGTGSNATATNQPASILLIVGVIASLALLTSTLIIMLLIRRKKVLSMRMEGGVLPSVPPTTNGLLSWQNRQVGSSAHGDGHDERIGQQLGNYRLIRLLGEGGFADVYLGEHLHLKTQAALKIQRMKLTESALQEFRTEAQVIARLEHPHIVRVLDFGMEGRCPFLVMSYAPNGTLRQRYPKGFRLQPEEVLPYLQQIASALDYAHQEKLIHRDIKPENLLLGLNNEVLLSDFGLVVLAQTTGSQTTKEMAGTVPYMAPEQLHGRPRPASDQYALGIIVYEWLSGDRPFQGSFPEIVSQHLIAPPPPLHGRVEGFLPAVERVVFRALAKDPHQRFASVGEFATAFEQACKTDQSAQFTSHLTPTLPGGLTQPTDGMKRLSLPTKPMSMNTSVSESLQSTYIVGPSDPQPSEEVSSP